MRTTKKGLCKRKAFVRKKGGFRVQLERFSSKRNIFVLRKRHFYLMQIMQSQPIKKSFFSTRQNLNFHRTPTNVQQPFLNTACHCELAVKQPFFETPQSCVSTTVTLSHRFKSSPAIPGKVAIPGAAGYMMNAGHFRQNYVSSGDLNRGRRTESRVLFMLLFARRKK